MHSFRPPGLKRKHISMVNILDEKVRVEITKQVYVRQRTAHSPKYVVLQEVRFPPRKTAVRTQLRIGYWIVGKRGRAKGRWTWGQFAPFIPKREFRTLLRRAERAGILQ